MKTDMNEIGLELLGMNLRRVNMDFARKKKRKHRFSGVKGKKRVGIFSTHPLCGSKHSISIGAIFFLSFFLSPPPSLLPFFFYSFDSKRKQGTFLGRVIRFFENKIRVDTCEFIDRMQQFV